MKLLAITIPLNKSGYEEGDLVIDKQDGYADIAANAVPKNKHWQAHNLIIVDQEAKIKKGDAILTDDRISKESAPIYRIEECIGVENSWIYGNVNGKDEGHNPYWTFKIIGSYMLIDGVSPIHIDFVRQWIANPDGEVSCEMETVYPEPDSQLEYESTESLNKLNFDPYKRPALQDGYLKVNIKPIPQDTNKLNRPADWDKYTHYVDATMQINEEPKSYTEWRTYISNVDDKQLNDREIDAIQNKPYPPYSSSTKTLFSAEDMAKKEYPLPSSITEYPNRHKSQLDKQIGFIKGFSAAQSRAYIPLLCEKDGEVYTWTTSSDGDHWINSLGDKCDVNPDECKILEVRLSNNQVISTK